MMRPTFHLALLSGVLCALSCHSLAQQTLVPADSPRVTPPPRPHALTGGVSFGTRGFKMPAIKNQPYALTSTTSSVRRAADGTEITKVYIKHTMRDAEGRERDETFTSDGKPLLVHITDPVAQNFVTLFPIQKDAVVTHFTLPPPLTPEQLAKQEQTAATQAEYRKAHPPSPDLESDLPPQTIAGIYATGHRRVLVIPASRSPTHEDIRIPEDTWTSPELKIRMSSVTDDPRPESGKITTIVTELKRADPDPALFQIPADYKVTGPEK